MEEDKRFINFDEEESIFNENIKLIDIKRSELGKIKEYAKKNINTAVAINKTFYIYEESQVIDEPSKIAGCDDKGKVLNTQTYKQATDGQASIELIAQGEDIVVGYRECGDKGEILNKQTYKQVTHGQASFELITQGEDIDFKIIRYRNGDTHKGFFFKNEAYGYCVKEITQANKDKKTIKGLFSGRFSLEGNIEITWKNGSEKLDIKNGSYANKRPIGEFEYSHNEEKISGLIKKPDDSDVYGAREIIIEGNKFNFNSTTRVITFDNKEKDVIYSDFNDVLNAIIDILKEKKIEEESAKKLEQEKIQLEELLKKEKLENEERARLIWKKAVEKKVAEGSVTKQEEEKNNNSKKTDNSAVPYATFVQNNFPPERGWLNNIQKKVIQQRPKSILPSTDSKQKK